MNEIKQNFRLILGIMSVTSHCECDYIQDGSVRMIKYFSPAPYLSWDVRLNTMVVPSLFSDNAAV